MSINVVLKSVFDDKGIKDAQKSLKSIGGKLKGALAVAGVGIGLNAMVSGLKEATREAVADAKSQEVLANSLRNTVGASSDLIASVEAQIKAMSLASGVADDTLRPAYQSLVTATGDVTKAQDLMGIALNVAADKNISVADAANVLGKAVNGTTKGLFALYPNLKNSSDVMGDLARQTEGASNAAANSDPITRLTTIFNEMQESIGAALIPTLQKFAEYMASPVGQAEMQALADDIASVVTVLGDLFTWVVQNKDMLLTLAGVVAGVSIAWGIASVAMAVYTTATATATKAQALFDVALGAVNPAALAIGIGVLAASVLLLGNNTQAAANAQNNYNSAANSMPNVNLPGLSDSTEQVTDTNYKDNFVLPKAPRPGQKVTWWQYEGRAPRKAVWYEQTWDGNKWSKAKKMTYATPTNNTNTDSGEETAEERRARKRKERIAKQKQQYKELAQSIKESFKNIQESMMSAFDITEMGSSAGRVISNVKRLIEQTKKFATSIKGLAAAGLNPDLLNQLIMAGPQNAGRLAANLLASGAGSIGELNAGYTEYGNLATGIASTGVQSMYAKNSSTYNITIAAGLGSKEQIAKGVVEAIKYYEAQNGKAWRA